MKISTAIEEAFPGVFQFDGIGDKGRSKSFEITVYDPESESGTLLWTGLMKGPPRKLKFPDPADIISSLTTVLSQTGENSSGGEDVATPTPYTLKFEHCKS